MKFALDSYDYIDEISVFLRLLIVKILQLDAQHALKRYEDASPSFADTREAKFIQVCFLSKFIVLVGLDK